jgi:hypothetical protein
MKNPPIDLPRLQTIMAPGFDYQTRVAEMRELVLWYLEAANVQRPISTTQLGWALMSDVWNLRRQEDRGGLYPSVLRHLASRAARQSMAAAVGYGPEKRSYGRVHRTYVWKRPEISRTPEEKYVELAPVDKQGASSHNADVCPHCAGTGRMAPTP